MKNYLNEEAFENYIEEELISLGWDTLIDEKFERIDYKEVINFKILKEAIKKINNVNDEIADKAINEIRKISDSLIETNIRACSFLTEGIKIYSNEEERNLTINLISKNLELNKYEYIRQLKVSNGSEIRIPDIVLYVNGLPIVIMELKGAIAIEGINDAFKQNESLKRHSPKLWMFNVVNFLSNNITTKYGSISSSIKHFYGWKKWNFDKDNNPIKFLFNKNMIYELINLYSFYSYENFTVKYLAAPHQINAVKKTIEKLKTANDNRGGVVWHTQGSGKSVTMVILTRAINMNFTKSTVLLVTDRKDLDQQLSQRFLNAEKYLRNKAVLIDSRKDLVEKLNDKKHFGIYFTTVQKFFDETGLLSDRNDIFILVDEAHRSQNNLDGERVLSSEKKELEIKFGYARYMRDAFPNAKITGFTGTPLMGSDKDTREVFGEYNHKYTMNQAVDDGATVPIHYEIRKIQIKLDNESLKELDKIQDDYQKGLDPNDLATEQKIDTLIKNVNITKMLEDEKVINAKSIDIINHLKIRSQILHGKAMIVANSRIAAFRYYKSIIKNFPEIKDQVILVMTGSNKDDEKMANAIVKSHDEPAAATEFRKSNSKYKIAIVVDKWLTGFDVPDLDVMYIDKIIKWHNLMQAIARVNRIYEDKKNKLIKETGLIVDYIGIWKHLSEALLQYAHGDSEKLDINIEDVQKAKEKLRESFDIVEEYYVKGIKNFDILNNNEKYTFIIQSFNEILSLDLEEKNKFIRLARKTKRLFKIAYSIITDKDSIVAKGIELINSMLTTSSIQNDEHLALSIELIKDAISKCVELSPNDVEIIEGKISRDINAVSSILYDEADDLIKRNPRVSAQLLRSSIKAELDAMKKIRPVFSQRASDKLKKLVFELEKTEDIEKVLKQLKLLAKEIIEEKEKPLAFQNPQLQAFFEVLSSDEFETHNNSSEVLRKIAERLMQSVRENITDQFSNNPRVKEKVKLELIKILKNEYNYPPENSKQKSGLIVDLITKEIKEDASYFRKED